MLDREHLDLPDLEVSETLPESTEAVVRFAPPAPDSPTQPRSAGEVAITHERGRTVVTCGWTPQSRQPIGPLVDRAVREVLRHRTVAVDVRPLGDDRLAATVAAVHACYRFSVLKTGQPLPRTTLVTIVHGEGAGAETLVMARASAWARHLVDAPPGIKTPTSLAAALTRAARAASIKAETWDESRLAAERCGAIVAVGQGSAESPRLVKLSYEPAEPVAHVALVGKGVCFDSGGLVLKNGRQMLGMKGDMAGAATAAAVVVGAAELRLPVRLTAWLPLVENMPGSRAVKVEDVVTTRTGRTLEVVDTDAEGRLILADALALAAEEAPDAIVDLATLTGSVTVALGMDVSSYFANDDGMAVRMETAAAVAGEPQWRLPLIDAYREKLHSPVADLRNCPPSSGNIADGVLAALLLEEFVAEVPWVHVDFAGPAYLEEPRGARPAGGTGFGVATLLCLLRDWAR